MEFITPEGQNNLYNISFKEFIKKYPNLDDIFNIFILPYFTSQQIQLHGLLNPFELLGSYLPNTRNILDVFYRNINQEFISIKNNVERMILMYMKSNFNNYKSWFNFTFNSKYTQYIVWLHNKLRYLWMLVSNYFILEIIFNYKHYQTNEYIIVLGEYHRIQLDEILKFEGIVKINSIKSSIKNKYCVKLFRPVIFNSFLQSFTDLESIANEVFNKTKQNEDVTNRLLSKLL